MTRVLGPGAIFRGKEIPMPSDGPGKKEEDRSRTNRAADIPRALTTCEGEGFTRRQGEHAGRARAKRV